MHGHATLVTGPAQEPVGILEAKDHLRVDTADEDGHILGLITAVRKHLEDAYGIAMITQTWDYAIDRFPTGRFIELPRPPLQSVGSVTYHDEDLSTSTVLSSDDYQVDTLSVPPRIALKRGESWPTDTLRRSSGVVVRFDAGFGDNPSDVPDSIQQAIKIGVSDLYENRESEVTGTVVARLGFAWRALMANHEAF